MSQVVLPSGIVATATADQMVAPNGIVLTAVTSVPVALTGTATASITESDVVTGGKTIILTLTGDTWVASGATFNAERQAIIDGIEGLSTTPLFEDNFTRADSGTIGNGWTEVDATAGEILGNKLKLTGGGSFLTNITYPDSSADFADGVTTVDYTHTGTSTIAQLYARFDVPAENGYMTFISDSTNIFYIRKITSGSSSDLTTTSLGSPSVGTNYRLRFSLAGNTKIAQWIDLDAGTILGTLQDNADSTFTASGSGGVSIHTSGTISYDDFKTHTSEWNTEVRNAEAVTSVVRTSSTVVTITLSAAASYDIAAQETVEVTVPASALVTATSNEVASPTFTVDTVVGGLSIPIAAYHYNHNVGSNL